MRRRRVILIVGACVVLAVLATALWPEEREPEYQGRKLSEWLSQFRPYTRFHDDFSGQQQEEAIAAVRHIGTNGLPFMLRWLRDADRPNLIDQVAAKYEKLPQALRSQFIEGYCMRHSSRAHERHAFNGLMILGQAARPVVPELEQLAADTNLPRSAALAGFVLRALNSNADLFGVPSQHVGEGDSEAALRADRTAVLSTNVPNR